MEQGPEEEQEEEEDWSEDEEETSLSSGDTDTSSNSSETSGDTTYYSTGSTLDNTGKGRQNKQVPWWFSSRLGLALFAFFGCMSMASQRVCMNVAIHCMLNVTGDVSNDLTWPAEADNVTVKSALQLVEEECGKRPRIFPENLTMHTTWEGVFEWTPLKQEIVFGTFFWGYVLSQVPSGWMATRFGGRLVVGAMMMLGSICTGLVPLAARGHYYTLILTRFLSGFGVGVMFPALHAVWGRWSPPEERSRLASIGFTGAMLGHVVTYPLSAVLCEYGLDGGWASIFYLLGGVGVIWSIFWIMFASSTPNEHQRISEEEKEYILEMLSGEALLHGEKYDDTPWITFFGSVPFMVIVLNHFTCEWGMYNFTKSVPYFMRKMLKYNIEMDPAIHAFPYIGLGFLLFMTGIWSDKLRLRGVIHTSIVRKIFQSIGTIIPATLMVGLGFLGCHQAAGAVSILVLSMTFVAFQYNGYIMNHLDIAPKYAGILFGISSAIGTLAEEIAPLLQGIIITEDSREQWQTWFLLTASIYLFGTFCFIVGGAGDVQQWALCNEYVKDESQTTSSSTSSSPPVGPPQAPAAQRLISPQPRVSSPVTRSKSIPASAMKRDTADSGARPVKGPHVPVKTAQPVKRLSVPDLPSELHRQPSQKTARKSGVPASGQPTPKRGSQKRVPSGELEKPAAPRRSASAESKVKGEKKGASNLHNLSESIV